MAEILAFRPKPDPLVALRQELARALDAALDIVDGLVARLDELEGDTDFEPDADLEATAAEWAGRGAHRFDHGLDDHGGAA